MVERRDGPSWLRNDDDDSLEIGAEIYLQINVLPIKEETHFCQFSTFSKKINTRA